VSSEVIVVVLPAVSSEVVVVLPAVVVSLVVVLSVVVVVDVTASVVSLAVVVPGPDVGAVSVELVGLVEVALPSLSVVPDDVWVEVVAPSVPAPGSPPHPASTVVAAASRLASASDRRDEWCEAWTGIAEA